MGKRNYTDMQALEPVLLKMRAAGMSRTQIAAELGLTSKHIDNWITRYNKRQTAVKQGTPRKPKGRPRTRPITKEEEYQHEIARLEMENKLLRDFLQSTERE